MQIKLKILTPEKIIAEKDVDFVSVESHSGSLGFLPGHAPLAASLKKAPLQYIIGDVREKIEIDGGFAKVLPQSVTVFTK